MTHRLAYPESCSFRNPVPSDTLLSASDTERVYLRLEAGSGREITIVQHYFPGTGWSTVLMRTGGTGS